MAYQPKTITLILLLFPFLLVAQTDNFIFEHLSNEDGLSNSTVSSILQDSKGFLWFGSDDGLNRYDGYEFKIYRNNVSDTNSISNSKIRAIIEDKNHNLWIATHSGLNQYISKKDLFTQYHSIPGNKNSLSSNYITSIVADSSGVWIANGSPFLDHLDPATKHISHYPFMANSQQAISQVWQWAIFKDSQERIWVGTKGNGLGLLNRAEHKVSLMSIGDNNTLMNNIRCIFENSPNEFWLGTDAGMVKLNYENGKATFTLSKHDKNNPGSISPGHVWKIYRDHDGTNWVATQNGLNIYDERTNTFKSIKSSVNNQHSLSTNEIWDIHEDKENSIWFGTFKGGINILKTSQKHFSSWGYNAEDKAALNGSSVLCFEENPDSTLWIGIDHSGLSLFDRRKGTLKSFTHEANDDNSLLSNSVLGVLLDSKSRLWVGAYGGGLSLYNPKNDGFIKYAPLGINSQDWHVWDIAEDYKGRIWTATLNSGVSCLDPETGQFNTYLQNNKVNGWMNSWIVYQDHHKNLWLGALNGLNKFNEACNCFEYYDYVTEDLAKLETYNVTSIYHDSKNRLWVGVEGQGLNLLDTENRKFRAYKSKGRHSFNVVNGILEDKSGNLWISINSGIARITLDDNNNITELKLFSSNNGLLNHQFNSDAMLLSSTGEMFFGGSKGLDNFFPDSIATNPYLPEVVLTDFMLFNKQVPITINNKNTSVLNQSIWETAAVTLSHKQAVFTIKYTALSFISPNDNQYAYKLEGFDTEWNYVKNRREATYTNLDAGKYKFAVKACNNDGVWNDKATTLQIIIRPPFWQTWWFRAFAIAALLMAIRVIFTMRLAIIKRQKELLQKKVDKQTKELTVANTSLMQQKEEMQVQKEEISTQKSILEEKNKSITSSISYAQRIQTAVLPDDILPLFFPDNFILFKPRDIVSGDFYWMKQIGQHVVIAAADCTGHGVPGAFMSMLGITSLNEIVSRPNVRKPGQVLNELRSKIKLSLKQTGKRQENKDGMDMVICSINLQDNTMHFAAAINPIYLVRKSELPKPDCPAGIKQRYTYEGESHTLYVLKGDRQPVGISLREQSFRTKEVSLLEDDCLYLVSDGYSDQFGGKKGRKFLAKQLKKLLTEIADKPMPEQKQMLDKTIKDWMAGESQTDDILVMGIRIQDPID